MEKAKNEMAQKLKEVQDSKDKLREEVFLIYLFFDKKSRWNNFCLLFLQYWQCENYDISLFSLFFLKNKDKR